MSTQEQEIFHEMQAALQDVVNWYGAPTQGDAPEIIKAAGENRYGHRDATMILIAFRHGLRPVWCAQACARGRSKNFLGTDSATTRTALVSTAIHAYALACIFDVSGAKNDAAIVRSSLGLRRLFAAVPFAALE